jgi:hypothetical protein
MKEAKAMLASWARSSIAGALAVFMSGNTNPKDLALGLLAGVVPLAMRWANPNDVAFGSKK